jgi:hypothetical protein
MIASPLNLIVRRENMLQPLALESVLTCPNCGDTTTELMPTDACVYFHECVSCHSLIRPKPGDCCVFCSYGSVKCPPIQQSHGCCSGAATPPNR